MALADYFARSSAAAVQAVAELTQDLFRRKAETANVGIRFGHDSVSSMEGRAILDMLIRLVARLYPSVSIQGDPAAGDLSTELAELALRINPSIDVHDGPTSLNFIVGDHHGSDSGTEVFVGSNAWNAYVSMDKPLPLGASDIPFGAGAAACLAAALAFRVIFAPSTVIDSDGGAEFSTLTRQGRASPGRSKGDTFELGEVVLAGAGAVGNAAAWALCRMRSQGTVHLVDPQRVDLGNLQRYVLCERDDEAVEKVVVAARAFHGDVVAIPHAETWADFAASRGYEIDRVLIGLDSARDRRAVQTSLPRWIANAWTQPGDLGLSTHPRFGKGACLWCLYLPAGPRPSDDIVVAQALGIPERFRDVRMLLANGAPVPSELLAVIAERLGAATSDVAAFEGQPIRRLYAEGVCGGAVIPLERSGAPPEELHVPLAPQSAFAGVILSAALAASVSGEEKEVTTVTRLDVLRKFGEQLTLETQADPRGLCICHDADFIDRYQHKYPLPSPHTFTSEPLFSEPRPSSAKASSFDR